MAAGERGTDGGLTPEQPYTRGEVEELDLDDEEAVEILNRAFRLLETHYPFARTAHIHNEASTLKRDLTGLSNLRDSLDHLRKGLRAAFLEENYEKAKKNVAQMEEHLCRAINEGAEGAAEYHITETEEKRLPADFIYKIAFVDAPSQEEIDEALELAMEHIEKGRDGKPSRDNANPDSWVSAVQEFKEAENIAKDIKRRIPSKIEVGGRLLLIVLAIIGAVGAIAAIV